MALHAVIGIPRQQGDRRIIAGFASSPWAPVYVIAAFVLGGLLEFPLILLIAGTAAALGPILGFAWAAAGSLASAVVTYFIGAWLGRRPGECAGPAPQSHPGTHPAQWCSFRHSRQAGADRTVRDREHGRRCKWHRFSHFIIGTALGLLPGLVTLSAMGSQIMDIIFRPSLVGVLLLAAAIAAWILFVLGAQALLTRHVDLKR